VVLDGNGQEVRDLDVTLERYKNEGFTLKWITVIRDAEDGLFQKSEPPNPLRGDAVRWAAIEGDAMTAYSLAISETGGPELQVYRRTLTDKGMLIRFMRLQGEDVKVRMSGELVRTE